MSSRPAPDPRSAYRYFTTIATRWMDNDVYGHVNNVQYYSFFDTVVNQYLVDQGVLDIEHGPVIGLVVETHCDFFTSMTYPDVVHAGLRVARVGNSSVRYEVALFRNAETMASAQGHYVHVYVDRASRRPVAALPDDLRMALNTLVIDGQS